MPDIVNIPLSDDVKQELAGYLYDKFQHSVKARSSQVDGKYKRWMDNYSGKPLEAIRTTPYYRASNFVPQLIRMHTDISAARMIGMLFGTKPFWKPRSLLGNLPHEWLEGLATWMEHTTFHNMEFFEPIDSGIFRTFKTGTCVFKMPWVIDEFYLGQKGKGQDGYIAVPESSEGIQLRPVPFDDFWPYPITANNLKETLIKFQRVRLAREEVEYRKELNLWDEVAVESLLKSPEPPSKDTARSTQSQEAGIQLTEDVVRPYTAIEAWLTYPLGGKRYKIVVVFNPALRGKESILRAYFNYYNKGRDEFFDMRFLPREDLFYGYSHPELLEQSQEEQAQIHNSRRDANSIANTPGWKKKRYADVPNPSTEWYPGKVFELEDMNDLMPLEFRGNYNSLMEEEQMVLQLAETYSGIGPPMQATGAGLMTGKRGIYSSQGTMAMLAEGNRRLDIYLKRVRLPFHKLGNHIYQAHKQFRPDGPEFLAYGKTGEALKKTFQFKEPEGFQGLFFDIGATDAGANKETDRQSLLLMANTMAGYFRQIVEAGTLIAQVGTDNPIAHTLLAVLDGAKDLADRLLFAFDVGDRERLLPDLRKVLAGNAGGDQAGVNGRGLPGPEGPVSEQELRGLSKNLAPITGPGPRGT